MSRVVFVRTEGHPLDPSFSYEQRFISDAQVAEVPFTAFTIADLKSGALAHLPSFAANRAWLVLAAIAFNLTRAAGTVHAKATTATIRRQLIAVPAHLANSARRLVLHLPKDWPWEGLFAAACVPPTPATT